LAEGSIGIRGLHKLQSVMEAALAHLSLDELLERVRAARPTPPRLFDPFSRAADSRGKPGAGVGLAIALSYKRRLRGELHYASGRPSGATFTRDLPTS
jgi:hypothetical protein